MSFMTSDPWSALKPEGAASRLQPRTTYPQPPKFATRPEAALVPGMEG